MKTKPVENEPATACATAPTDEQTRRIRVYAVAKPGLEPIAIDPTEKTAWFGAICSVEAIDRADYDTADAALKREGYRLVPGWLELEEGQ